MDEPKVKSLYKALKVLECFLEGDTHKGVSEIAQTLNLPKSTVSNILSTYLMTNLLELDKVTGKYRLGIRALELSNRTYQNNDIRAIMQPYIDELAKWTNEEILLAVCRDHDVVYIGMSCDKEGSRHYVIGSRAPMYCTGIGKAMLMDATEEDLRIVFERGTVAFTDNTILDIDAFRQHMLQCRRQRYCVDNMEHEYGIRCVAVPIRNQVGDIVAGMSISGPSLRIPDEKIALYGQRLIEISERVKRYIIA